MTPWIRFAPLFLLLPACTRLGFAPPVDSAPDHPARLDQRLDPSRGTEAGPDRDLELRDGNGDRARNPLGLACHSDGDCASGHCADGVCCESSCAEACFACDQKGSLGTCLPLGASLEPRGSHPSCGKSSEASCGLDGTCDGKGSCRSWPTGTVCKPASCDPISDQLTPAATCDGAGTCKTGASIACAPYRCAPSLTACRSDCVDSSDCASGNFCAGKSCGLKGLGAGCATGGECASGHCVDGVCCASTCAEPCRACNLAPSLGTCATVPSGQPVGGRPPCAGSGVCQGQCSGGPSCSFPTVSCRAASCAGSTLTLEASCDGKGACPGVQTASCAPYICDLTSGACLGSCTSDSDCVSAAFCAGPACLPQLGNGNACTRVRQCSSSHCVDQHCCTTACEDQCLACDLAGALGTCSPVPSGQPRGGRPTCAGSGTACGGSCAGTSGCSYPGLSTSCASCAGSGPFQTTPGGCNGSGGCTTTSPISCGNYQCLDDLTGCRTTCAVQTECWNAACEIASAKCVTCFPAGTPVLTPEGARPIERIRPGDLVQTYDTLSGRAVVRPVLEVERQTSRRLLRLRPGGGEELEVTPEHYFWVPAAGWVRARELEAGDNLLAPDGTARRFSAGRARSVSAVAVYNLVVREFNAYFVGRPPVLVHSCTTIGFTARR